MANTRQATPTILRDGSNGVIIVWADDRNGAPDLYGQRLIAAGTLAWGDTDLSLSQANGRQECPALATYPGGLVLAWRDNRDNPSTNEIFLQKFDLDGQSIWPDALAVHQGNNFAPYLAVNSQSEIITASYFSFGFNDVISAQFVSGTGVARFRPQQKIVNAGAQGRQANLPSICLGRY